MPQISDEELMVGFQRGNAHAFELLFEKYRTPVFSFLYRMLNRQKAPAEDLLQEIFMKIAGARELYEPTAKFSTWLFTIARNHCLNYIRSRRYLDGVNTASLDGPMDGGIMELKGTETETRMSGNPVEEQEIQGMLEQAIGGLPEKYREVFVLHAVEGLTHQEVSRILKMNPATVRTHYHRARIMLRETIGDFLDQERSEK